MLRSSVVPAGAATCTAVAAVPWLRGYRVHAAPAVFIAAAVVPIAVATVLAEVLRRRPVESYLASVGGLVVLLLAVSGPHPDEIAHALSTGPTRLLTETLPLSGSLVLLAAPIVVVWVTGAVTAELLARTRVTAAALIVPVLAYLVAFAATSGAPGGDEASGPVLLVALAITALARHTLAEGRRTVDVGPEEEPRSRAPWRRAVPWATATALVAIGVALAAAAIPRLGSHPAAVSRSTPVAVSDVVDPVALTASLRDSSPHAAATPLLEVRTDGRFAGYLTSAVLSDYDGDTWTFDPTFAPSGGRVPAAADTGSGATDAAATVVRQSYRLVAPLPDPLAPTISRVLSVQGLSIAADAGTGMIVPTGSLRVGTSYQVVSRAATTTLAQLPAADGIGVAAGTTATTAAADTALPDGAAADIGSALRTLSPLVGQRPAPTVAYLRALAAALVAKDHRIDPAAPTPAGSTPPSLVGTSLAQVIDAVTVQRLATPEQYATLLVVVARYLGVPSRLVTGFRAGDVGTASPGSGLPPGSYTVTNRQAWTWAEVPVAGLGWVVVDPTPAAAGGAGAAAPEQVQTTPTTTPPLQANAVPTNSSGGHAIARPIRIPKPVHRSAWHAVGVAAGAGLAALVIIGLGLGEARRARRRRLRHRSNPAGLAVGAWLEVLDALDRAGLSQDPSATSAEVAAAAGSAFGPAVEAPVRAVGAVADQALYRGSASLDPTRAEQAWVWQRTVRRNAFATLDRRQRLRALLAVGHAPTRPDR